MERNRTARLGLAFAAALLAVGCGSSSSPTAPPAPTPTATPAPPSAGPIVLDGGNFAQLVLASPRPSLVEFQRPT